MRVRYSLSRPDQEPDDAMPRIPITLRRKNRQIEVQALVDSGATVNVLPFQMGRRLGAIWDDDKAVLPLAGILGTNGIELQIDVKLGEYPIVNLSFAWVKTDRVPVILGQYDFFENFRVCFERYNLEFEITPKPKK